MILENNKTIDGEKQKGLLSEQEAKILIVDDEKDIRKLVGIYLKKQGYKTLEAENGQMAINVMKEHSDIDLVIMDIMMPVMDGLTATRAIRALERADAKTIPIIAMTANAFSEDIQHSLAAGMNAHVSKPIEMKVLEKTIRSIKSGGGHRNATH